VIQELNIKCNCKINIVLLFDYSESKIVCRSVSVILWSYKQTPRSESKHLRSLRLLQRSSISIAHTVYSI